MASFQDSYQTGICGGGWWNPGRNLLPLCSASISDFMWLDSSLNDMEEQVDQMKEGASYSRSDDSSYDHRYSSDDGRQHLSLKSSDYAQTFQQVQKPQVADFNISNWSEYNLAHDSPNMSRLRPVVSDQKNCTGNNNNSNDIHDFYFQGQFNSTSEEYQTGSENIISSFAYPAIIQSLDGPDTIDMSCAFENSYAPNWPKILLRSPSPKEQLNTSTKHTNANTSVPFWDCWMGNDELDTHKSHQLQAPVAIEDRKPCNYEKPTSAIDLVSPKIDSKDTITQKLASGSTLLETKRKNNTTARDGHYKRPRFETPSSLPTFKVRKEKLGDRITALQQLVSPFGKTDTASVLHEAIEYIKFLHDQVLRTPYMQNGTPTNQGESKNAGSEGPKQDLRSRGLCLVHLSNTFPVANETSAYFWTPTFGGTMTFR